MRTTLLLLSVIFLWGCDKPYLFEQKFMGLNGTVISVEEITYRATEQNGEIITGEIESTSTSYFTQDGQISHGDIRDEEGETVYRYKNEFKKGRCVLRTHYRGNDKVNYIEKLVSYKRNEEVWDFYDSMDRIIYKITLQYDKKTGKVVNTNLDGKGDRTSTLERYFDKNGNVLETKYFSEDGEIETSIEMKYDTNNFLTEIKTITDFETLYTYQYRKTDHMENWIERIEYADGEAEYITIRNIEYAK